ncbi:MAG TPA: SGNH/GDSL hydrolase family protein [Elusimicrobiales bacterium]|nr:SGNH/GDSL hydrolase family protein [Elusimicrobiales bacterium]
MKKLLLNILVSLLAFAAAAGVLEGALRLYNMNGENYDIEMWKYSRLLKRKSADPAIGIEHIPGREARLQNVDITINSLGLRDREYAVPKPKGVYRIIVLGSSITLGWGVPEDRTFARLTEKALEGRAGPMKVEVINAGIGNYNTQREVRSFLSKYAVLDPDMVVLTFFINDPQTIEIKENPVLRNSQLAVLLWSRYQQGIRAAGIKETYADYYRDLYSEKNPGWPVCVSELDRLAAYCRGRKIRLMLAMIPDIHNLKDYPFLFAHDMVRETAVPMGYSWLDLYDALKNEDAPSLWAMRGDPHPNVKGHELMAGFLAGRLLKDRPWEGGRP